MAAPGTATATRVAEILLLFTDGPEAWGISGIARELDLPKAVVHRAVHSLVAAGLLIPDPNSRGFRLGPAMVALGARAIRDFDLREDARPLLHRLQQATGETATLSVRLGLQRAYVDQVASDHEIRMTVELGQRFPLHAGSSGKVILALLPPETRETILAQPLVALTEHTMTDPDRLRRECEEIRACGFARSHGQRQAAARSVAGVVLGVDGLPIGSMSICGPAHRVGEADLDAYVPELLAACHELSAAMGYAQPGSSAEGVRR